jgi:hypothetical protein
MNYALPIISLIAISSTIYAFNVETDPQVLIERENREKVIACMENVQSSTWTARILQEQIEKCAKIGLVSIIDAKATTGSVIPVPERKWYTTKHSLILTGSHDYRQYSARKGAGWKNNNPSGLTWGISNTLKWLWNDAGIGYQKWSLRPSNEWGNYILFDSVEDGLMAKMISVRIRWGKATVSHFLAWWGTDSISLSFDKEKRIEELSDGEFMELFVQQLKKETPGYISELVADKILIIQ